MIQKAVAIVLLQVVVLLPVVILLPAEAHLHTEVKHALGVVNHLAGHTIRI
jgi:hypothetical protein